jgi:ribosomal protein L27
MREATCPIDGMVFTTKSANKRYCSKRCARAAENRRYRSYEEDAECKRCGVAFIRQRGRHLKVYCSDGCHRLAKAERYSGKPNPRPSACPHGSSNVATCPACTFFKRVNGAINFRRVLRADPCAYCGQQPCSGVDHIEPADRHSDRGDVDNWTGCCKRCNALKGVVPLLPALLWMPVCAEYHAMRRQLFAPPGG